MKPTSQSRRDFDYNFAVSQRAIRSSTCQTRRPVLDSPLTPATEYGRYTREQIEDREVTITTRVQRRLAKAVGAKQALSKSFTADKQRTAILDKMDEKQQCSPTPTLWRLSAAASSRCRPGARGPPLSHRPRRPHRSPPSSPPALLATCAPFTHTFSVLAHRSVTRTLRHGILPLDRGGANDARTSGVACVWGLKGGRKAAPALVCRRG